MSAPPFTYFGSKQTMAAKIGHLLPEHNHYVEPFGGSLAVLLAKQPSRMETVNDLDADLQTFWKVLRDQSDELQRVCALTPHSRAEQGLAQEWIAAAIPDRSPVSDLERARRVWVCLTQGRGGQLRPTGWRHYEGSAGSSFGMPGYLAGYVSRMGPAVARLAHVSLECRPALELIRCFGDHDDVCLYIDPPYVGSTRVSGGYRHEMRSDDEHRELAAALVACDASVVLSGYPSPLYDELYAGWHRLDMAASTGQGGTWANRTEVLWSNRPLGDQPHLFDDLSGVAS
ncbi:MAG TPA: DNA adenine methylase [Pseudonocardiaceae bacterium]|jgi:DNA adenine methylase